MYIFFLYNYNDKRGKRKMLKDQLPVGFLKIDYDFPLLGEASNITNFSMPQVLACVVDKVKDSPKEMSFVMCLDSYYRPQVLGVLGMGTEEHVEANTKDIAQFALLSNARAVVLIHNHPSNGRKVSDLKPSSDDIAIASKVAKALSFFNIELADSVIINSEWTKNFSIIGKNLQVDEEEVQQKWTRIPSYFSMRSHRKYAAVLQQKNVYTGVDLKNPEFKGEDLINTQENAANEITKDSQNDIFKDDWYN